MTYTRDSIRTRAPFNWPVGMLCWCWGGIGINKSTCEPLRVLKIFKSIWFLQFFIPHLQNISRSQRNLLLVRMHFIQAVWDQGWQTKSKPNMGVMMFQWKEAKEDIPKKTWAKTWRVVGHWLRNTTQPQPPGGATSVRLGHCSAHQQWAPLRIVIRRRARGCPLIPERTTEGNGWVVALQTGEPTPPLPHYLPSQNDSLEPNHQAVEFSSASLPAITVAIAVVIVGVIVIWKCALRRSKF